MRTFDVPSKGIQPSCVFCVIIQSGGHKSLRPLEVMEDDDARMKQKKFVSSKTAHNRLASTKNRKSH